MREINGEDFLNHFVILFAAIAVDRDASSRSKIILPVFHLDKADHHAAIQRLPIKITADARIIAARNLFGFSDQLHGRGLGRSADRAGGQEGRQHIAELRGPRGRKLPDDLRTNLQDGALGCSNAIYVTVAPHFNIGGHAA